DVKDSHNLFVDMNGDGRVDFVHIVDPVFTPNADGGTLSKGDLKVLLNQPGGWAEASQYSFALSTLRGQISGYHLADINRDGLPDLVSNGNSKDNCPGNGTSCFYVGLNTGAISGPLWKETFSPVDPNINAQPGTAATGDISGDGNYDSVASFQIG